MTKTATQLHFRKYLVTKKEQIYWQNDEQG